MNLDTPELSVEALRRALATHSPEFLPPAWHYLKEAAVLVGLLETKRGLEVLLTKRADSLRQHKGQISFPGGRRDPADADSAATALRETQEELGISPNDLKLIGSLDETPIISGYRITPHVAILTPPLRLRPAPEEIARVFTLPLALFFDEKRHRVEGTEAFGLPLAIHYYDVYEEPVWGATGRIVAQLVELLRRAH